MTAKERPIEASQVMDMARVVVKTMAEPVHSAYVWLGAHDKGVWGRRIRAQESAKDENFPKFFNHHHEERVSVVGLGEMPKLLDEIDVRLKSETQCPQNFIAREQSEKWVLMKGEIEHGLAERRPQVQVMDYVASSEDEHSIFLREGDVLKEIKVKSSAGGFSLQEIETQLNVQQGVAIETQQSETSGGGYQQSESVAVELAIGQIMGERKQNSKCEVRRMSSITNDFYYKRHALLEREGVFFTTIRHMGVHTLGEIQNVSRLLFDDAWTIDPNSGELKVDQSVMEMWVKVRSLPFERFGNAPDETTRQMIHAEARTYLREQAYYRLIMEKLKGSELVESFMQSTAYQNYSLPFRERHLAAYGATEEKVARSMLAGMYLFSFEGMNNPYQSPSQRMLAKVKGYHREMAEYLINYEGEMPTFDGLANGRSEAEKQAMFSDLLATFTKEQLQSANLDEMRCDEETRVKVLTEAENCIPYAKAEMGRNPVHRQVIESVDRLGLIVSEGSESRVGMGDVFIGNLMLKTVDINGNKRFTFPWLRDASGYLGVDSQVELPPVPEAENIEMDQVIRDIFSGETDELGHPYLTQEQRVFKHTGTILKYLTEDQSVPVSVRKFVASLTSNEAIVRVIETMGNISDNDPNIVNRFFPEGVGEFHKGSIYRYVFDFVRGIESNLIVAQGEKKGGVRSIAAKLEMFAGNWRNRDFSRINHQEIEQAIKETLVDGHSRLIELNHAVGDIDKMARALTLNEEEMSEVNQTAYRKSWKTIQEKLEVVFGWDTTNMKYLRWQELWNVWHTLGAAWDCICFTRKTIFNPKPLKASY